MAAILFVCLLLPLVDGVMEQMRGPHGISWRVGSYRNRNVIPMPPGFLEKKHRRDEQSDTDEEIEPASQNQKKSLIRDHFSLPIGPQIPLGFNNRAHRKGKKSVISTPLSAQLADNPRNQYAKAVEKGSSLEGRSDVPSTWGLTWKDPHPNPALTRDTSGYERSTLAESDDGMTKNGKISEQEFDSGLMGRGLGGMKERAQNENLMEGKFEEKMSDEEDVENENRSSRRKS